MASLPAELAVRPASRLHVLPLDELTQLHLAAGAPGVVSPSAYGRPGVGSLRNQKNLEGLVPLLHHVESLPRISRAGAGA